MSGFKRILTGLRLDKIAAVDRPCQEPAVAVIMKRREDPDAIAKAEAFWKAKYSAEQRREMASKGEAMKDGSYPIADGKDLENAIHAVGRGRNNSHAAIRAHIKTRAKALGMTDKLPETWGDGEKVAKALFEAIAKAGVSLDPSADGGEDCAQDFEEALGEQTLTQTFWDAYYKGTSALQTSLISIFKDDEVTDKASMVNDAMKQFAEYIEQILPGDVGKALAAEIAAFAGEAGAPLSKGAPMDEIKKALGLPATATDAEVAKAIALNAALAKMSEKHKAFMNHPDAKLPKGGKEAFAEMEPSERDDHIKANPIDDEDDEEGDGVAKMLKAGTAFKTPEGAIVRKSKVGEDLFAVLKSQNDRLVKAQADLAKAEEEKKDEEMCKRAEAIGCERDFGATLRKAYGGDATAQAEVEKRIKALTEQARVGGVFKTFGHDGPGEGTATAELVAKVAEIKKAEPKLSDAQARTRAYEANPGLMKRVQAEQLSEAA